MARFLALDYGEKRIGVALSDPLGIFAQAHPYILNGDTILMEIQRIIAAFSVDQIVLGLPKNCAGKEGRKAEELRLFAEMIKGACSCPIVFVDERFSTAAANKFLLAENVSRKGRKEKVDSLAAQFFLQGYLDSRSNSQDKTV
mgnify:CR=1 FL=1